MVDAKENKLRLITIRFMAISSQGDFPRSRSQLPYSKRERDWERGLADRSISTSNFPTSAPRDLYNAREREVGSLWPTMLGPLGHFLCSAPAEDFLALPSSQPPIPSAGAHRGGQDRPIWAAVGLVLRGPSTAACSTGMGEDTSLPMPTIKCRGSRTIKLRDPAYVPWPGTSGFFSSCFQSKGLFSVLSFTSYLAEVPSRHVRTV